MSIDVLARTAWLGCRRSLQLKKISELSVVLASSKANFACAEKSSEFLEVSMDGRDLQLKVFRR